MIGRDEAAIERTAGLIEGKRFETGHGLEIISKQVFERPQGAQTPVLR